jgi:hypothetical protein
MLKKPVKKTDQELFSLIASKISQKKYVFLNHAKKRQLERGVSDLDVLNILEGKIGYCRTRNKKKDVYEPFSLTDTPEDWKYCIEGKDIDGKKVRIIITFSDNHMPIITVIRIH